VGDDLQCRDTGPFISHQNGWLLRPARPLNADVGRPGPPRNWAGRTYRVTRYTVLPRGGHFAAYEEPDLFADDLTEFFRPPR